MRITSIDVQPTVRPAREGSAIGEPGEYGTVRLSPTTRAALGACENRTVAAGYRNRGPEDSRSAPKAIPSGHLTDASSCSPTHRAPYIAGDRNECGRLMSAG